MRNRISHSVLRALVFIVHHRIIVPGRDQYMYTHTRIHTYACVIQTLSEALFTSLFARAFNKVCTTSNTDRYRKASE